MSISIYEEALNYAIAKYPDRDVLLHYAFANSVAYYVTGKLPMETAGPSIREHLCSWSLAGDGEITTTMTNLGRLTFIIPDGSVPRAGSWSFSKACDFCEPIVYGSLPLLARKVVEQEFFFDDTKEDLEEIRRRLVEELEELNVQDKKQQSKVKSLIAKVDKAIIKRNC